MNFSDPACCSEKLIFINTGSENIIYMMCFPVFFYYNTGLSG